MLGILGRGGRQGGLEGGPSRTDALTTHLTGGVVEAPGRRDLEEGELTCHALIQPTGCDSHTREQVDIGHMGAYALVRALRTASDGRAGGHEGPRAGALDGQGEVEQQGVLVVPADDLHAHRQTVDRRDGDGDGGVAADVGRDR